MSYFESFLTGGRRSRLLGSRLLEVTSESYDPISSTKTFQKKKNSLYPVSLLSGDHIEN